MASMNKENSGYLMLLILAESDGSFDKREGNVIVNYIRDQFPFGGNLDQATAKMSSLTSDQFEEAFEEASQEFYSESTKSERTDFLRFSMSLVRADNEIAKEENALITKLFEAWDV